MKKSEPINDKTGDDQTVIGEAVIRNLPENSSCGFYAIILAAGQSTRMKREKGRLPWMGGEMLLPWMVQALAGAGWKTKAVVAPESFAYWDATLPVGCAVLNPDPSRGKISSLVCGVETLPSNAKWILISGVDQPRVPALYHHLREEAETCKEKIIVPTQNGHRGHPVVLSGCLRDRLLGLDEGTQGLRGLMDSFRLETHQLPEDDSSAPPWDLNTPAAYELALQQFQLFVDHQGSSRQSRAISTP